MHCTEVAQSEPDWFNAKTRHAKTRAYQNIGMPIFLAIGRARMSAKVLDAKILDSNQLDAKVL